jgi:hypothetical protein
VQKEPSKKQRLKRDELVDQVFAAFSERYESTTADSIYELTIPLREIRAGLNKSYGADYNSDTWIFTQLRRYEREHGVRLFEKADIAADGRPTALAIYGGIVQFTQKRHLYVNQKLRIANGVYDTIRHLHQEPTEDRPLSILLGSGNIPWHVAEVIAERAAEMPTPIRVYTHNIAVVARLLEVAEANRRICVFSPGGRADPTVYSYVGGDDRLLLEAELSFVIQSTNSVHNGLLYVNTEEEGVRKGRILRQCSGTKVLALVKDEFHPPAPDAYAYGRLSDYDYIVTVAPRADNRKTADRFLEAHSAVFQPLVLHWSYQVIRVDHAAAEQTPELTARLPAERAFRPRIVDSRPVGRRPSPSHHVPAQDLELGTR